LGFKFWILDFGFRGFSKRRNQLKAHIYWFMLEKDKSKIQNPKFKIPLARYVQ
jgi:hypothetical protein